VTALIEQVAKATDRPGMLPNGSRILLAVSGGVDSMVLLHLLHELAPPRAWNLSVAHLNHQLRGRSSEADARFVKAQSKRLGLPCVTGRRDVKSLAKRQGISIEMAARELRHRFLARVARQRKCAVIALAHHADDQAELVLLRLLRGSGSEGLGGMECVGASRIDASIRLIRPLLEVSRAQIVAFAGERRIPFREDRSNASRRFLRNRVRHELLPLLRQRYQPAIDRVLIRTASILTSEAECISQLASAWLQDRDRLFDTLPLAVKRRVIQQQSMELGVPLDFDTCERLVLRADRRVNGPDGQMLVRARDGILGKVRGRRLKHSPDAVRITLSVRGAARFAGHEFEWRIVPVRRSARPAVGHGTEVFDAERVGADILLRHWQAGDRFQPIGMAAPVKLQDLFTNQKVPSDERRDRVVAESESGEVFWVEGLRIGERFKLASNTRKHLIWRWTC